MDAKTLMDAADILNNKKLPAGKRQIYNAEEGIMYIWGESTIEVDFVKVDEVPSNHPFGRVKSDATQKR